MKDPDAERTETAGADPGPTRPGPGRTLVGIGLAAALGFLLVEGCSSVLVSMRDAGDDGRDRFAEYDPRLGWVSLPSFSSPDYWARGVGLHTNRQRFRGREDVPASSGGRPRILCLGDSFAFGDGVADESTWCHLLGMDPDGPETVNLGQPGYGMGQTYLRYRSVADSLDHTVVLFSFIIEDVWRMRSDARNGYAKPVLAVSGDSIAVENVPVPSRGAVGRWVAAFARRLRVSDFGQRVLLRLGASGSEPTETDRAEVERLVRAIFEDLSGRARAHGAVPVTVFLPRRADAGEPGLMHGRILRIARDLNLTMIDLTRDLRALPVGAVSELFIPEGASAGGHYSTLGHRWVADLLERHLSELQEPALPF